MSIEHHSISVHFARTLAESVTRQGVDVQPLLHQAGLSAELLENCDLRITSDQLSRLMQAVWRTTDDEFMGMGSHPSRHGVFSLVAKQAVQCHTLRSIYYRCAYTYSLVANAVDLKFTVQDNEARFIVHLADSSRDPQGMLREMLLLVWHRFPSWLIGQKIRLNSVRFDFPEPAHKAEHRLMFPCQTHYNQENSCLVFDRDQLDEKIAQTPQALRAYLKRAPLDWFKRQAFYPVFTRRVMDFLESAANLAEIGMDETATHFHLTSRTLRRKLAAEGSSFQRLKDGIRQDAAIHLLSQPELPISEIAKELGFSEPTAFTRAFKQWTGVLPSVYRRM